jgi:hypothetical protein
MALRDDNSTFLIYVVVRDKRALCGSTIAFDHRM